MKYKVMVFLLALTVMSWAQSATTIQTPASDQKAATADAKAGCPCCEKMSSAKHKKGHGCMRHNASAKNKMQCGSGKDSASCCKREDGKSCMQNDKTADCCVKGKCDGYEMSCCSAKEDGHKAQNCCDGMPCCTADHSSQVG